VRLHPQWKITLLILSFSFSQQGAWAQKRNPTVWPYGGEKDVVRADSLLEMEIRLSKPPVNFPTQVYYADREFQEYADFCYAIFKKNADFRRARFRKSADFYGASFDHAADFSSTHFFSGSDFQRTSFDSMRFQNAHFDRETSFDLVRCHFATFERAVFDSQVVFVLMDLETSYFREASFHTAQFSIGSSAAFSDFEGASFKGIADFSHNFFLHNVSFLGTHFDSSAYFNKAHFSNVDFHKARFRDASFSSAWFRHVNFSDAHFANVSFSGAEFDSLTDFSNAEIEGYPNFEGAILRGTIVLSGTRFLSGIDLRRAELDSVDEIYVDDHFYYPPGKFLVKWEQISGRILLFVDNVYESLQVYSSGRKDLYSRIDIVYQRLRDNYLALNDPASADAVMFELGQQRAAILREPHWIAYGWLFGFGYQPWRFLLYVVLPLILLFAGIWYHLYYEIVMRIVDEKIDAKYDARKDELAFATKESPLLFWGMFKRYDHRHSATGLDFLARYWHVLYFSASVLLGIRIKKEWIQAVPPSDQPGRKSFLRMLTFQWLLGIGLYVAFALLVKGSHFDLVKGLLGF
jgi:uncharacterized protein YjbI with pentapeptide repeats